MARRRASSSALSFSICRFKRFVLRHPENVNVSNEQFGSRFLQRSMPNVAKWDLIATGFVGKPVAVSMLPFWICLHQAFVEYSIRENDAKYNTTTRLFVSPHLYNCVLTVTFVCEDLLSRSGSTTWKTCALFNSMFHKSRLQAQNHKEYGTIRFALTADASNIYENAWNRVGVDARSLLKNNSDLPTNRGNDNKSSCNISWRNTPSPF